MILRYLSSLSFLASGVPLGPKCSKTSALALTAISGCCVNAYMVNAINAAVWDFFQEPCTLTSNNRLTVSLAAIIMVISWSRMSPASARLDQ